MTIEVVALVDVNGSRATKVFEFSNVETPETQECGSIAVINEDGDYVAEFRNWDYWRKTSD
jgi:hypothetical protein